MNNGNQEYFESNEYHRITEYQRKLQRKTPTQKHRSDLIYYTITHH